MSAEWTPERVAAARNTVDIRAIEGLERVIVDLARIGLRVVEASQNDTSEMAERAVDAIFGSASWSSFWHRDDAKVFALAVFQALADGGRE